MSYFFEERGDACVLIIENLNTYTSLKLIEEVENYIADDFNWFIADLTELKTVNSDGLNILITILTKTRNAGGDFAICNLSEAVSKLLIITKLKSLFNIYESVEDALTLMHPHT